LQGSGALDVEKYFHTVSTLEESKDVVITAGTLEESVTKLPSITKHRDLLAF
jgi:hypothetical protein